MRVLVCDDHRMMAQVLVVHLREQGHDVVMTTSPPEALAEHRRHPADVVVLDLVFPGSGTDGAETVPRLLEISPETRVLVLTGMAASALARQAVVAGAHGLLDKGRPLATVSAAVARQARGRAGEREPQRLDDGAQPQLTAREREVLSLLVQGCSTVEMGERLGISVNTVRKHVQKLLEKFGSRSRLQVVALAARRGHVRVASGPSR